jgi:hypothetical protein
MNRFTLSELALSVSVISHQPIRGPLRFAVARAARFAGAFVARFAGAFAALRAVVLDARLAFVFALVATFVLPLRCPAEPRRFVRRATSATTDDAL